MSALAANLSESTVSKNFCVTKNKSQVHGGNIEASLYCRVKYD